MAFVVRAAFALAVSRDLTVFNDEHFYHHAAETLSEGDGLRATAGGPTAQWPPAYPFTLSLVYRTGAEPLAGQLLNALIGALTVAGRACAAGVLVLFATALVAYGFVYYGNFRYRAPLEPLMLLVSAPLLVRLWDQRDAS